MNKYYPQILSSELAGARIHVRCLGEERFESIRSNKKAPEGADLVKLEEGLEPWSPCVTLKNRTACNLPVQGHEDLLYSNFR